MVVADKEILNFFCSLITFMIIKVYGFNEFKCFNHNRLILSS